MGKGFPILFRKAMKICKQCDYDAEIEKKETGKLWHKIKLFFSSQTSVNEMYGQGYYCVTDIISLSMLVFSARKHFHIHLYVFLCRRGNVIDVSVIRCI